MDYFALGWKISLFFDKVGDNSSFGDGANILWTTGIAAFFGKEPCKKVGNE